MLSSIRVFFSSGLLKQADRAAAGWFLITLRWRIPEAHQGVS